MKDIIKDYILNNNLISQENSVVCATSGGVDSVCLLHILKDLGYKPILAHVNHHKRQESELEQKEMEKLAMKLNIPFEHYDYYYDEQENFQDDAHYARHAFFKNVAQKYNTNVIATAHHLNDQAETILIKMLSGSNLYGYAGISNKISLDDYIFIRPLMCVTKEEIYKYAQQNKLVFFEDSSNSEDDYLRNRLRHNVIPLLEKENPSVLKKLQDFSLQLKEAFNFIRNQSIKYLNEQKNIISISSFNRLDIALKKDIICLLFERYKLEKSNEIINNCLNIISKNTNNKINLKNEYIFYVEYGFAGIKHQHKIGEFCIKINIENSCLIQNKYFFYFSKKIPQNNAKYIKLCYNDLKVPLTIRNRYDGDFMKMPFGSKKVSRILIDSKIPEDLRNSIPLVYDNEGELLWIYGIAKSKNVIDQKKNGDLFLICEEKAND